MKKKRQDKVTNHTGALYTKNETKSSRLIQQGVVYDVEQIEQRRDRSYRCGLLKKWN